MDPLEEPTARQRTFFEMGRRIRSKLRLHSTLEAEFKENIFKMKYVLVTGGVVSGLGKGVTASSIGVLLKACGHRVTSIKIGGLIFL